MNLCYVYPQDYDILVEGGSSPVYGDLPFTHQSRGCGSTGDHISLPITPLLGTLRQFSSYNTTDTD